MRIRTSSFSVEPFECQAEVSSRHPRCCFGNVVLVIPGPDGGAVGPSEAEFAGFEVVEATADEKQRLAQAGYRLKGIDLPGFVPAH
jgi:hypothetical protein